MRVPADFESQNQMASQPSYPRSPLDQVLDNQLEFLCRRERAIAQLESDLVGTRQILSLYQGELNELRDAVASMLVPHPGAGVSSTELIAQLRDHLNELKEHSKKQHSWISLIASRLGIDASSQTSKQLVEQIAQALPPLLASRGQSSTADGGRNLVEVIDRIAAVDAGVGQELANVQSSAEYAAPELMSFWWTQAADILAVACPPDHPKHAAISEIFNGPPQSEGGGS